MSDIFISYASEDRAEIEKLAYALETQGWSVWWDRSIPIGQSYASVIEAALDEARCVIVIWSEISVKSNWVRDEVEEARSQGYLFPLSIDGSRPPMGYRYLQTANFSHWSGDVKATIFKKLVANITSLIGEPVVKVETDSEVKEEISDPSDTSSQPTPYQDVVVATKKFAKDKKGKQGSRTKKAKSVNHSFQQPEMVRIPGGKFLMGSPKSEKDRSDDEQQHEVFIDDFAMGKYPVTFTEYDLFCEETGKEKPDDEKWGRGSRPVINVSWEGAYDYAQWLARLTGKSYRLPTEAEWEYAARGGTSSAYWWGNDFEQDHINSGIKYGKTTPVNTFKPNPFGLYDMLGNAMEWTGSLYKEDYDGTEKKCAEKRDSGARVLRGGSYYLDPEDLRSAMRFRLAPAPHMAFDYTGFRLAQD